MTSGVGGGGRAFLTAAEALGLVAYGDPAAFEGSPPGFPDMWGRWGFVANSYGWRRDDLVFAFRWVLARTRWRLTRERRQGRWRRCPLPPLGRGRRAKLRSLMHRHGKSAARLLTELRSDMERARIAVAAQEARHRMANRVLCDTAAAGSLQVFGRRGIWSSKHFATSVHEPVPPAFFLHEHREIQIDGWATLDDTAPMEEWAGWRNNGDSDWGDLRFSRPDVLRCLPSPAPAASPKMEDLPARWTLLECLAWIMFRDTGVVRDASLENPREAAPYWAEIRTSTGDVELARLTGEPGYSRLRLSLEWAYDRAQGSTPSGLAPGEAESDLLTKLRSGAVIARGRSAGAAATQDMDPGDWRGLMLREEARGHLTAEPEHDAGRGWGDVTLAQDDVVRVWPARSGLTTAPTIAGPVAPEDMKTEAMVSSGENPTPVRSTRRAGGRPEREDWVAFDREMMRLAALDGGNLTVREFRRRMKDWAAGNMEPVPDDRTIERRIDARVPAEVFAPD